MVGLGWALNVAGSISRTVKGYNDFEPLGYVNDNQAIPTSPITQYVNDVYTILNQSYYDHLTGSYWVDTEPDIYTYNFIGSSGMFVLSKKSQTNGQVKAIKLKQNPDSIYFDESGKYFVIMLPNGYKGTFDIHEYTLGVGGTSSHLGAGNGCDATNVDIYQALADGKRAITTWHLSKIESPFGRELNFEYLHQPGVHSDYISVSASRFGDYQTYYSNLQLYGSGATETCSKNIFEHVYLSKISSNDTGDNILFNYSSRQDIEALTTTNWLDVIELERGSGNIVSNGAQRITGINIYNNLSGSSLNKSVVFDQSYFNDTHINDPDDHLYLRLKLDKVTVDDQIYAFDYLDGINGLPDKSTKSIDYWGYYNGQSNTYLHPEIGWLQPIVLGLGSSYWTTNQYNYYQVDSRKANFDYGQAGLLYKVTYPTGGSAVFDYESHEYKLEGDEYVENLAGGYASASGLGGPASETFDYIGSMYIPRAGGLTEVFPNGCPIDVEITFRVLCKDFYLGGPPCEISGTDIATVAIELLGPDGGRKYSYAYDQLWGPGISNFEQTISFALEAGTYTINAYNVEDAQGVTKYYGEAVVSYMPQCDPASSYASNPVQFNQVAGGARIASITSFDENSNAVLKKSYEYVQDPPVFSSGKLMSPLHYVYEECNTVMGNEVCIFLAISGDAMAGGGAAQGSHIGYSRVKETFAAPNGTDNNGHIWHYFLNESNEYESYGVAPKITRNRENGIVYYEYTTGGISKQVQYNDNYEVVGSPIPAIAQRGTGGNQLGILDYYDLESMFITPKEIVEYTSYPTGAVEIRTNRNYNNYFQLASEITSNSDGDVLETVIKYPYDITHPTGGVYDEMIKQRLLLPVEKQSKVNGQVLTALGTKFKLEGSSALPDEVYSFNSELGSFVSTTDGLNFNGGYEQGLKYVSYNSSSGKVEEYVGRDGIHHVFIWGYDMNLPVAKISNASKTQITALGISLDAGSSGLTEADANTIRNGLPHAMVTTYTYDPGIGIISQTDPSGIKTEYEYDEFNRLKMIKDDDGNIVQHQQYHYKEQ
jgi:YD repeat-containing protein